MSIHVTPDKFNIMTEEVPNKTKGGIKNRKLGKQFEASSRFNLILVEQQVVSLIVKVITGLWPFVCVFFATALCLAKKAPIYANAPLNKLYIN